VETTNIFEENVYWSCYFLPDTTINTHGLHWWLYTLCPSQSELYSGPPFSNFVRDIKYLDADSNREVFWDVTLCQLVKSNNVSNIVIPSSSGSSSVIFIGTLVTKLPTFRNVIVSSYSRSGSARVVAEKEVSKNRFTFFFSVKQRNIYRNTWYLTLILLTWRIWRAPNDASR